MGKNLMGQLKTEMFHVFGLFGTLSFRCQIFLHAVPTENRRWLWITRMVWKVLGLTMEKRMYNFKIIFIFQHNLP